MRNRTFQSSLAPYNKTECLTTYTEETNHTTNNPTKQTTQPQQSCHTLWKKRKRTATPLVFKQFRTTIIFPIILLSLKERPPRTNLTDQPHNHPRMLGHENSPCEWVTSHLSEDMGYAVSSMGVFGDPCTTNSNELKSCSETQRQHN